ncbi:MAG: hypothetical protein DDT19_00547 [Syntrophomonadaceae bacterium]|nr:hypothetical protein [Bacillota bacterium]
MDRDYPTEKELRKIKSWEYDFNLPDGGVSDLLDYLESLWWGSELGFKLKGKKVLRLELHTFGWSGNEDIISALHKSWFWRLYWEKSVRGGHFYFKCFRMKKGKKEEHGK